MEAQASLGLWDVLFWILTGSSLLGLPPGERDPGLVKSVPPQTLVYFEWASRGPGKTGATGVDGFAADPEVRQFFEMLDSALAKRPAGDDESMHELRIELPQLVKLLTAHPGCLFVGFEPKPVENQGLPALLSALIGIHGGVVLSTGNDTDQLWKSLITCLKSNPDLELDEASLTHSIPIPIPGYEIVLHREGSRIILAIGEKTLPRILEGLSGRVPGLESNQKFRSAMERVAVPRVSTISWIDGQGIVNSTMTTLGPLGIVVRPILTIAGVDGLGHVAQVSGVDDRSMIQRTFVATGGKTDGILVVSKGEPIQSQNLAHIPADADLVVATSISLRKVYDEARRILAMTQPLSVRVFDEAIKQLETELELKIIDDVLPAFGDVVTAFDSPSAGGIIATSLVISLEVTDRSKAVLVFDRVMKLVEQSLATDHGEVEYGEPVSLRSQQFLDHQIFYVNSSGGFGAHFSVTPTFCLTEKHLLMAVHPQAMKAQLRHLQVARPGFDKQAAKKVPLPAGEVLTYVYVNGAQANGLMSALLPYLSQTLLVRLEMNGIELDSYSIPSAAAISPYFGDFSAVVTRQKDGLLVETLNAPPAIVTLALLNIYQAWQTLQTDPQFLVVKRKKANDTGEAQLGAVEGGIVPANAESKEVAKLTKPKPSPYQQLAPLLLKSLIPDDIQKVIPESAFRRLEEGPSTETLERRAEARRKREERRRERLGKPR